MTINVIVLWRKLGTADPKGKANQRSDPMNTTMSSRQIQAFLDLAEQKGMTPDRMTKIFSSGVLADVLDARADLSNREAVRQVLKLDAFLPESIILEVNYDEDLETMITAGNYHWHSEHISANRFTISGMGIVKFVAKLVHPNCDISSAEIESQIKDLDALETKSFWVPGKIEHVLAFGKLFQKQQFKYPIVGLGSVAYVFRGRYVPCLFGIDDNRRLDLTLMDDRWPSDCRFLAVRKVSAPSVS